MFARLQQWFLECTARPVPLSNLLTSYGELYDPGEYLMECLQLCTSEGKMSQELLSKSGVNEYVDTKGSTHV